MQRDAPFPTRRAALVAALVAAGVAGLWIALSSWSSWRLEAAQAGLMAAVGTNEPDPLQPETRGSAEQDAIRWLLEGTAAMAVDSEEGAELLEIIRREPGSWSSEEREMVAALARREAEALALLERAGALHGGSASAAIDEQRFLGEGPRLLRGTLLLLARAGLALGDGPSDAGRTLSALGGIARTLEAEPSPLLQALAVSVEGLYLRGVHWMAEDPTAPTAVLADLLDGLSISPSAERIRHILAPLSAATVGGGADPPATWWRRLERASHLTTLRRVIDAAGEPAALLAMAGPSEPADEGLAELAIPNLVDLALRMQAIESSRRLARIVLGLRIQAAVGGVPELWLPWIDRRLESAEPDPLAGGLPLVTAEGGAIFISNPTAGEAWESCWGADAAGRRPPPPYIWRLPPEMFREVETP